MSYQARIESLTERLAAIKIIPVLAVKDPQSSESLAETLVNNGLPCAEVTFRTDAAVEVMRRMKEATPSILIGAGTVLTREQVDLAIEANADFAVSPGFNPDTVRYAMEKGLPFLPGVNSPSLVEQAMALGLRTLKFFPASISGGTDMLKALNAVYPVNFMPTGGIKTTNANDFLNLPNVFCCGGTWMVAQDLIDAQDWETIGKLTQEAADSV